MSIIITWMIYFGTCIMQRILCKLLFWCGSELGAWIRVGRRPNRGRFGGPQISRTGPSRSESNCLLRYWRLYNDTLNAIVITNLGVFNACLYGTWRVLIPRSFKIWGIILIYLWKYWTILTHIWGNYGNYFLNSSCPIWTI